MQTPAHWSRRGATALALLPLAALHFLVTALRRALFRAGLLASHRMPVPVIVVGNVTAGGTGKTPFVLWLVAQLRLDGWHPGIVTRGYGGRGPEPALVPGDGDPRECGDEPVLLARRAGCPVWRGRDRVAAGRALLAAHPGCDVIVSDDGLQHYRLTRDVEIALVDGSRGFGNGLPLPAGPMREPAGRLAACDLVVVKLPRRAALSLPGDACGMQLGPVALRSLVAGAPDLPPDAFAGQRVHAVAGIGDPAQFFETLRRLRMEPVPHPFPDHHDYQPADLAFDDDLPIVTTEKDAVKSGPFEAARTWVLVVDAQLDASVAGRILARLPHGPGPQAARDPRGPADQGSPGLRP